MMIPTTSTYDWHSQPCDVGVGTSRTGISGGQKTKHAVQVGGGMRCGGEPAHVGMMVAGTARGKGRGS